MVRFYERHPNPRSQPPGAEQGGAARGDRPDRLPQLPRAWLRSDLNVRDFEGNGRLQGHTVELFQLEGGTIGRRHRLSSRRVPVLNRGDTGYKEGYPRRPHPLLRDVPRTHLKV